MMLLGRNIIYGSKKPPNTFIGGVGNTINTPALLAEKLTITAADISGFKVVGNNIECHINKPYYFQISAFQLNNNITYYLDVEKKAIKIGRHISSSDWCFYQSPNLKNISFEGATMIGREALYFFKGKYIYAPEVTSIGIGALSVLRIPKARYFFPKAINIPKRQFDYSILAKSKGYFNIFLKTNNAGGEDKSIINFRAKGGIVIWVLNDIFPNPVSDLTHSNITSNSVQLNFTPPSSTNALDFYEVFIDDGTENPLHLYTTFKEINNTGDILTGLLPNTTYKIQIIACDEFWNRSEKSNIITIKTLP